MEQLKFMRKAGLCLLLSFCALIVNGRQTPPPATNSPPGEPPTKEPHWPKPVDVPKPIESSIPALTNTPLRMVEPGVFELGKVRLDQRRRSVTLPAVLDRAKGPMEYFLVTTYGKTHESVLKTQAEPYHIHLAMLLLGAEGSGDTNFPGSPANGVPGPVVHPAKEAIPGLQGRPSLSNGRRRVAARWSTRPKISFSKPTHKPSCSMAPGYITARSSFTTGSWRRWTAPSSPW